MPTKWCAIYFIIILYFSLTNIMFTYIVLSTILGTNIPESKIYEYWGSLCANGITATPETSEISYMQILKIKKKS